MICLSSVSCHSKKITSSVPSKFYTDSLYSKSLNEYRKHNVYLPKGFQRTKSYPIIYATDGGTIKENDLDKVMLDSLIENSVIKPIILVQSHANRKVADSTSVKTGNGSEVILNYRNFEYVNDFASLSKDSLLASRFKNHMHYFNGELISHVENAFNQSLTKENRYFYGFSNGAGFGLSMLNNHPNTIGTYLCFSTFGGDIATNTWQENVAYPKLYLQYGSEEPEFLKDNAAFLKSKYEELNLFAHIKEFNGGHDHKIWHLKFIEIISQLLAVD